ncbi:hypothetical protein K491DRAFT_271445 [Lophiostoma macrostomum CBS 122681]|uniref:Uncharacterized protein n=1 Tax=Lophiostoma macrostomum CBS 122681 TaxID=1314788 RepID=A0A6A6SP34_9PLEO|nr:hypothetical protein K491DRAFT_271445 [Lophiostoma macrostomum CBS 122681]
MIPHLTGGVEETALVEKNLRENRRLLYKLIIWTFVVGCLLGCSAQRTSHRYTRKSLLDLPGVHSIYTVKTVTRSRFPASAHMDT